MSEASAKAAPVARKGKKRRELTKYQRRYFCAECNDPDPDVGEDHKQGDVVCRRCGTVLGRIISEFSEWRTFSNDSNGNDPVRVGSTSANFTGTLASTSISRMGEREGISALASMQSRTTQTTVEKKKQTGFRLIRDLAYKMALNKVITDTACRLYNSVVDKRVCHTRRQNHTIVACVYIALRKNNVARTWKEICAVAHVPPKIVKRCFKAIDKALTDLDVGIIDPSQYIGRFAEPLNLSDKVISAAKYAVAQIRERGMLVGRNPATIASAALFMACHVTVHEQRTFDEIAPEVGMVGPTIAKAYSCIREHAKDLLPARFLAHCNAERERHIQEQQAEQARAAAAGRP